MSFGKKIKQLRLEKNMTLTEAAEKLGMNKGSLSRYENDTVEPSLSAACRIAKFYGARLDFLAED